MAPEQEQEQVQEPNPPSPISPEDVVARLRESQRDDLAIQPRPVSRLDRTLVRVLIALLIVGASCGIMVGAFLLFQIASRMFMP